MIAEIVNFADRQVARMLERYRNKTRTVLLVRELADSVQEVEAALWDLISRTAIDTADGVWLEGLGRVVGENREGATDTEFRRFIRARIRANRSAGTVEDIIGVLTAWNGSLPTLLVVDRFPAGIELTLTASFPADHLPRLIRLLKSTRAAGVGTMLIYQHVEDANAFTFSSNATLQVSSAQGFGDSSNPATGGQFVGADRF